MKYTITVEVSPDEDVDDDELEAFSESFKSYIKDDLMQPFVNNETTDGEFSFEYDSVEIKEAE